MSIYTSCMGGWCKKRDECAWHLTADRRRPTERMSQCERGNEKPEPVPVAVFRPDTFFSQVAGRESA